MGLWNWIGKSLEISGRVMQAEGVDKWIEAQGEKFAKDFVVNVGGKALGGRELRKEFISQLRHPLEDRQFSVRINATWEDFLSTMDDICGLITYAADVTSRDLFLAPYFLLNANASPIVKNKILKAEAFSRLISV